MLIIVCGLPGSGKTTIAEALSKRLGGCYLSSDIIRKQMHGLPSYDEDEKRDIYRQMAFRSLQLFRGGEETIVLDATFFKREYIEMAKNAALKAGSVLRIIVCKLDEAETKKRLNARKAGPSDADYKIYLKVKDDAEPVEEEHLDLDSSQPLDKCVQDIIDYIERMENVGESSDI